MGKSLDEEPPLYTEYVHSRKDPDGSRESEAVDLITTALRTRERDEARDDDGGDVTLVEKLRATADALSKVAWCPLSSLLHEAARALESSSALARRIADLEAEPTPEEIEAATIRMYQSEWFDPKKAPGEQMEEVWRNYTRRCLSGFLEARRARSGSRARARRGDLRWKSLS